jgi:rhodanese-related sulfurtransferase
LSQGFKEVYSLQGGFEQWNEFLINKKADDKYENKNL